MAVGVTADEDFEAPDAVLVNRRWVQQGTVEWVQQADRIMLEHGAVSGTTRWPTRHQARWRVRKLRELMMDLGLHDGWELREHTTETKGGFMWTLEYIVDRTGA